jgi:hypothetical protein
MGSRAEHTISDYDRRITTMEGREVLDYEYISLGSN